MLRIAGSSSTVVTVVDSSIGEALGQLYVAEYFPPESKARMLKLVNDLRASLHDRILALEWMDDATKAKAIEKLEAFTVKIGYPDKWPVRALLCGIRRGHRPRHLPRRADRKDPSGRRWSGRHARP